MSYNKTLSKSKQYLYETVVENLEKGYLPWQVPWASLAVPTNPVSGKAYTGINSTLLFFVQLKRKSADHRWATFNQIKEKDWHLQKGSKGVPIEYYSRYDFQHKKKFNNNDNYIETVTAGMNEVEKKRWIEKNIGVITETYYVFNGADIEGLPELEQRVLDADGINHRCDSIIASSQARIIYDQLNRAYYDALPDEIHLPGRGNFNSTTEFYATALHEMAHSTGHQSRLDRKLLDIGHDVDLRAKEELRAEIASMFIQQEIGISLSQSRLTNHAAYIQSWLGAIKDDPTELVNAFFDAGKIEKYIFNRERTYLAEMAAATTASQVTKEQNDFEPEKKVTSKLYLDYLKVKEQHKDSIVMYRVGDFYEMYDTDAETASKKLDLILTNRSVGQDLRSQMCGVPCRTADEYIATLIKQGEKVVTVDDGVVSARMEWQADKAEPTKEMQESFLMTSQRQDTTAQKNEISTQSNIQRLEAIERNVPAELKALNNWAVFKYVRQPQKDKNGNVIKDSDGKVKYEMVKKIYDVNQGVKENGWMKFASPIDPNTWTSFEKALRFAKENSCSGITLAMDGTGMSCIDIDKLHEKESAKIVAEKLLKLSSGTYAEKSVSGNGVHIFVKGTVGDGYKKRNGDIECYHSGRFMSVTGNLLEGHSSSIKEMSEELKSALRTRLGKAIEIVPFEDSKPSQYTDQEVIDKVLSNSRMSSDFTALMNYGAVQNDTSADDFNFCKMLSYYTQDIAQIDRIFRQHRYREKKGEKYVARTITRAIGSTSSVVSGRQENIYLNSSKTNRELKR